MGQARGLVTGLVQPGVAQLSLVDAMVYLFLFSCCLLPLMRNNGWRRQAVDCFPLFSTRTARFHTDSNLLSFSAKTSSTYIQGYLEFLLLIILINYLCYHHHEAEAPRIMSILLTQPGIPKPKDRARTISNLSSPNSINNLIGTCQG